MTLIWARPARKTSIEFARLPCAPLPDHCIVLSENRGSIFGKHDVGIQSERRRLRIRMNARRSGIEIYPLDGMSGNEPASAPTGTEIG
jgi:hypothetical protein